MAEHVDEFAVERLKEFDDEVAELLGTSWAVRWRRQMFFDWLQHAGLSSTKKKATHICTHTHCAARTTHRHTHETPRGRGVGTPRVIRHHGLPPSSEAMGSVGAPAPGNGSYVSPSNPPRNATARSTARTNVHTLPLGSCGAQWRPRRGTRRGYSVVLMAVGRFSEQLVCMWFLASSLRRSCCASQARCRTS